MGPITSSRIHPGAKRRRPIKQNPPNPQHTFFCEQLQDLIHAKHNSAMVPFSVVKGIYIAHQFCPTTVKSGTQKLHLVPNIMHLG